LQFTLAVALVGPLAWSCKERVEGSAPAPEAQAAPNYAGIVFDVGGIDDKSFNESAHRGLMRAKTELGIGVEYYQPSQPADRKTGLRRLCSKKFPVVIVVGFNFTD
jgi:basic membrane protein A